MNRPKDKNRPKGPMSAYSCFVQVIREEHKKKHPGEQIVFSDFSKKCAERWKVSLIYFILYWLTSWISELLPFFVSTRINHFLIFR